MKTKATRYLDAQGRIILPNHIRKTLNLAPGSAVAIDMTEDGKVVITPTQERCCICGEGVAGQPHLIIETWNGPKYICESCDEQIHKEGEWME